MPVKQEHFVKIETKNEPLSNQVHHVQYKGRDMIDLSTDHTFNDKTRIAVSLLRLDKSRTTSVGHSQREKNLYNSFYRQLQITRGKVDLNEFTANKRLTRVNRLYLQNMMNEFNKDKTVRIPKLSTASRKASSKRVNHSVRSTTRRSSARRSSVRRSSRK